MLNFGPLTAEKGSGLWGIPANFNGFRDLASLHVATSLNGGQPNFARCLAVSWAGTLYVHFMGLLPRNRILPCAKFTLRPSLGFSFIGSVTCTALEQWASGKVCSIVQGMELRKFRRWCHLYSAGRPSRWASAHILVSESFSDTCRPSRLFPANALLMVTDIDESWIFISSWLISVVFSSAFAVTHSGV